MKIFLAQQNYHIGNFESNTKKIISAIEEAKKQQGDLIIFSEMCVCGYPPRDFLEFDDFLSKCNDSIDLIKEHADSIAVLVGAPAKNPASVVAGTAMAATGRDLHHPKMSKSGDRNTVGLL